MSYPIVGPAFLGALKQSQGNSGPYLYPVEPPSLNPPGLGILGFSRHDHTTRTCYWFLVMLFIDFNASSRTSSAFATGASSRWEGGTPCRLDGISPTPGGDAFPPAATRWAAGRQLVVDYAGLSRGFGGYILFRGVAGLG